MEYRKWWLFSFSLLLLTCCHNDRKQESGRIMPDSLPVKQLVVAPSKSSLLRSVKSKTALYLDSLGLKDIREADSSIIIQLMYATSDNFTREPLYGDLKEAYLHPDALQALLRAHQLLKEQHPGYRLIVYDAARPISVQKKMWAMVKGTPKNIYVSNPAHGGGLHNYGLAVDVSITDDQGIPLPMGTGIDHFGPEAHITREAELVSNGTISEQERANRQLLRKVMKEAGFRALNSEWWHFNRCSRNEARLNYPLIK